MKANARINPALAKLARPIGGLRTDPANAREHPQKNLDAITQSLTRFGQQKPVIALRDGTVIAGNGMLEAARKLGWKKLAVVVIDTDDPALAKAYALADNRTAELAEWNFPALAGALKDLRDADFDIATLGWEDFEIAPLLSGDFSPPEPKDGALDGQGMTGIRLTHEQFEIFKQAAAKVRGDQTIDDLSDGRCLELICADFLAGN